MTDEQLEDTILYGTPEQVVAKIQERIQVGLQYLIFNFDFPNEENALNLFAEKVMPHFK
jgi:alkanesulfonate monooxygenase SsuD/methylene tetrahydromethanopterin reductase-like flavin-dependent oxidoreductase (luciferase family)